MKKLLIVSALVLGATAARADQNMVPASAEPSAFQASLTPDIAIHSKTTQINGFTIDVWSQNPQHSFNLGIVNGSTGGSKGFSWAVVNYDDSYTGVQWGLVNHSKQSFKGWEDGLVNISEGSFTGFQHGLVNISKGKLIGWQDGGVNVADKLHGFQSGLVNYAKNLHGVQIGLINIALNNGWFDQMPDKFAKGFPIVNWSF